MTQETLRRIPADSFRVRLAIVRTEMGWNYDEAERATGVGSESWRLWEKGERRCSDVIGVSRRIADATDFDQTWLALGGPLAAEEVVPTSRSRRSRASTSDVITETTRGCVSWTRPGFEFEDNVVADPWSAAETMAAAAEDLAAVA